MKNIKRIAEDIFKAPTEEELVERWMIDEERKEPRTLQDLVELAKYVFSPYRVISGGYYETVEDVKPKKPNTIQIILLAGETQKDWERFLEQNLKIVSYKVIKYWAKKLNFKIEIKENIKKKRAAEIFQAPSRYDLLQRRKMTSMEFDQWLFERFINKELREKLSNIFSKGAVVIEEFDKKELHAMINDEFASLPKKKLGIMRVRPSEAHDDEWADVVEAKYGKVSIVAIIKREWDKTFLIPSDSSFLLTANVKKLADEIMPDAVYVKKAIEEVFNSEELLRHGGSSANILKGLWNRVDKFKVNNIQLKDVGEDNYSGQAKLEKGKWTYAVEWEVDRRDQLYCTVFPIKAFPKPLVYERLLTVRYDIPQKRIHSIKSY